MKTKILVMMMAVMFIIAGNAFALDLGANITIFDGVNPMGIGQGGEDQEIEPGTIMPEVFDLEGMFFDAGVISMVGEWDFVNPVWSNTSQTFIDSGDLFIDTDGDVVYGTPADNTGHGLGAFTTQHFGYDYVVDLDFVTKNYVLYEIVDNTLLSAVLYDETEVANPWAYASGGVEKGSGSFEYYTGLTDAEVGFASASGLHNLVKIDLSNLAEMNDQICDTFHFTQECGNDNLMGRVCPIPEPASMMLLGLGAFGFIGFRRKK